MLIKGLKRLEYRGYDSAGVALITDSKELKVYKTKGKVADLEAYAADKDTSGCVGIAHTRWATHGEPTSTNAHPHISFSGELAIIHNGIIENYAVLKKRLQEKGIKFTSDTDTEVLVQLIDYVRTKKKFDLLTSVRIALRAVIGAYAIAILDKTNPDQIIAARKSSPLVIGIGDGEFFLGSDASPIIEYTNKVIYLDDKDIAVISKDKDVEIVDLNNEKMDHEVKKVEFNLSQIEKGGFPHFMLKEIYEQPNSLKDCMRGRINIEANNVVLSAIIDNKKHLINPRRIIILACGTSWHAGLIGKLLIEEFCQIPVEVDYASEFRYSKPVLCSQDVVIAISQSGETADTLAAIELAKSKGAFIYGICNAIGSSIPRTTDTGSYIHVGPEIGVASTKAFTGQVTVLAMLALALGKERGTIDIVKYEHIIKQLADIPAQMEKVLKQGEKIKDISRIFTYARNFLYLGRGYNYPVALEGALKLKEISYIHAEGYPAAEMKHGPIALIDDEMPVVVVATKNTLYEKVVSNIQEIKARHARVIAIVSEGDDTIRNMADSVIDIPHTEECLEPLLVSVPLQMLAYYIAVAKGKDVDQPRNLAKSVTVE